MESTVLLIEDDEDAREIAKIILELNGFKVIEALNGMQAINAFYEHIPDIIILDLSIPPKGGIDLMKQFKKDPRSRETPVLAFTALSSIDEQEALKQEGFDDVIPKPCRPQEIVSITKKYLKEWQ